jgi:hypothetical protein
MDDWNGTPKSGKPWREYIVVVILAVIALAVAVAYAMSRFAPAN